MRRGSMLMPMNFITPSVQRSSRFERFLAGEERLRRLWLMMTTRSEPSLSRVAEVAAFNEAECRGWRRIPAKLSGTWRADHRAVLARWRPATAKAKLMLRP